jgi:hypothetical protein
LVYWLFVPDVRIDAPPPDRQLEIGRASELVVSVQPAPKTPPGESGAERSAPAARSQPLDMVQREALMEQYVGGVGHAASGNVERHAQRAVRAYNEVAQGDRRNALADMLGVSEYA